MKNLSILILTILSLSTTYAQIGINTDGSAPHISAQLDVKSTTKAFYPPRMTTAEKEAIVGKQVGAVVFDITLNQLSYYNGSAWVENGGSSLTLPYTGIISSNSNLLYLANTNTTQNLSTIYGATNSSTTAEGIRGAAVNSSPTNNTVGILGLNKSLNSFGYGVQGIHEGAGIGGHFSSNTGYALITNNGNVGIGTPTPTLGGLTVNRKAGAVNALFGSNTTGVAIETDYPGIGLNTFYNNGRKMINTGFGALMGLNPNTGTISVYNTATSITGQGTAAPLNERLTILANGNVGVGNANPTEKLEVNGNISASSTISGAGISSYTPSATAITGVTSVNIGVYGSANGGTGISGYSGTGTAGEFNSNSGLAIKTIKGNVEINAGKLVIKDGTQAKGRLIESDINGVGTWRENIAFLAKGIGVTDLSVPVGGSGVDIPFNTEDYDFGNNFSGTTFTAPISGVYHFDARVTWDQQTITSGGQMVLYLIVSGNIASDNIQHSTPAYFYLRSSSISTDIKLFAGETVKLNAFQNTSNPLKLVSNVLSSSFSGRLLFTY